VCALGDCAPVLILDAAAVPRDPLDLLACPVPWACTAGEARGALAIEQA
jgi:hypothetical protein